MPQSSSSKSSLTCTRRYLPSPLMVSIPSFSFQAIPTARLSSVAKSMSYSPSSHSLRRLCSMKSWTLMLGSEVRDSSALVHERLDLGPDLPDFLGCDRREGVQEPLTVEVSAEHRNATRPA